MPSTLNPIGETMNMLIRVNVNNIREADKVYHIDTGKATYRANSLDGVFKLWYEAYDSGKDTTPVVNVGSVR